MQWRLLVSIDCSISVNVSLTTQDGQKLVIGLEVG